MKKSNKALNKCLNNYQNIEHSLKQYTKFMPEKDKRLYLILLESLKSNNEFLNRFYNLDKKGVYLRPSQVHDLKDLSNVTRNMYNHQQFKSNETQFKYLSQMLYFKSLADYLEEQL